APAHMHNFKDVDTVEREKGRLVEALRPDGVAVLNADDARVARMAFRSPGRSILYGEGAAAELRATSVHAAGFEGLEMTVSRGGTWGRRPLRAGRRRFVGHGGRAGSSDRARGEGCRHGLGRRAPFRRE